jgi:redox-sensitive bicupin YhaK (pirin superfamily)
MTDRPATDHAPSAPAAADPVLQTVPLGFQWPTIDPFLFCVHHDDAYPEGNDELGPAASLAGRDIGSDFAGIDGWRMYHGDVVPGFPQHPHRGFETVTFVRRGLIDHSDSLGATARFGRGDVQWLTAGEGIVHSEMFPLLDPNSPNPVELFQIWLNLPSEDKLVPAHFTMLWSDDIPTEVHRDGDGGRTEVTVIAGRLGDSAPPSPPPHSWASRTDADVAIWSIRMEPGARWLLPAAQGGADTGRILYFFDGATLQVADHQLNADTAAALDASADVELVAGAEPVEILVLQGRPIGEPVAQHGPFVMNTRDEIAQAFEDYRRTGFGGWPWPQDGPVHGREDRRFARHVDGREETRPSEVVRG